MPRPLAWVDITDKMVVFCSKDFGADLTGNLLLDMGIYLEAGRCGPPFPGCAQTPDPAPLLAQTPGPAPGTSCLPLPSGSLGEGVLSGLCVPTPKPLESCRLDIPASELACIPGALFSFTDKR